TIGVSSMIQRTDLRKKYTRMQVVFIMLLSAYVVSATAFAYGDSETVAPVWGFSSLIAKAVFWVTLICTIGYWLIARIPVLNPRDNFKRVGDMANWMIIVCLALSLNFHEAA